MTQSQVLDQKTFGIGVLSITACVLFVGFLAAIPSGLTAAGWPWRKAGTLVLASLVPFGPFVLDRALRDATSDK